MVLLQDAEEPFLRSSYVIPEQLVHVLFMRVFKRKCARKLIYKAVAFSL